MREALAEDAGFLLAMLVETVNWHPERKLLTPAQVLATPALAHYVDGWPREDDGGVVAEDADGRPIGAAWFRYLTAEDPGYGFVDDRIPEVAIGVVADRRGRGVGRALLDRLHLLAHERGIATVSLSVEKANPARRLYERCGYAVVRESVEAVTMRLTTG